MAPETCEQRCKALEELVELLKLEVADLRNHNKNLQDQVASREHNSNPKCEVKVGEQEELISKLLKCHDYFCCDRDQASRKLLEFVSDKVFVDLVQAPGSELEKEILSIVAKLVMTGMIDVVYRLHLEGVSLDGNFSCSDFHWISNKKVKLGSELRGKAQLKTDAGVKKDYGALHGSINEVFDAAVVIGKKKPSDCLALLHLLASADPNRVKVLIRYNIALMDEIAKKNHFLTMFGRFEQLLIEEKQAQNKADILNSDIVLSFIISGAIDWSNELGNNRFVLKAHNKHLLDKGYKFAPQPGTINSRKELLEKWRHSLTHLHEHSVELGVTQFNDTHHVQMLESCTPGVFRQFQEGMHAIGELEYAHLMTSLKA